MICARCRDQRHGQCRGGSWCDCQHLTTPATAEQQAALEGRAGGDTERAGRDDEAERQPRAIVAEPAINWRRQG